MISLDTETTGLDLRHGARPFLVSTCDEEGNQQWWEWDVDPLTRQPDIPAKDLSQILQVTGQAESLVLQNPKFDFRALESIRGDSFTFDWVWERTWDTLLAGLPFTEGISRSPAFAILQSGYFLLAIFLASLQASKSLSS
jgi:hypothetical protein